MKTLGDLIKILTPKTLVVLDIDSTLVLTHKRNEAILRQFAKDSSHSDRHLFKQTECNAFEYGYYQALQRLQVDRKSPVAEELARYWRQHFFSNNYLHHDLLHDGALDFVEYLQRKWIPHVYLTGRPHPSMWEGTLSTLNQFGFVVDENKLFLKPQPQDIDEVFKSEKMAELKKAFAQECSQIVFIDNEPRVLNQIDRDHPDIHLVFVDTCHSPNVIPPSTALKIKDFREVAQGLKAL